MNILILGAGMMGRAIAFDLIHHSTDISLTITDSNQTTLKSAQLFLKNTNSIEYINVDVNDTTKIKYLFKAVDIAISAVPYHFNYALTKIAIQTGTHFLDLGGNNDIVNKQRSLYEQAKKKEVLILPDCGLAPGMISILTRDIVEYLDTTDYVKIRVGGIPIQPIPPLNYQIVFSPNGLINEYVENALVLDHGSIVKKPSMTEIESLLFPPPFYEMEAFLTSGGCSTLPYTYQNTIAYLDYKTIRYPGHCAFIKPILDMGFADEKKRTIRSLQISPREMLIKILEEKLPSNKADVVLVKILSSGIKNKKKYTIEYTIMDYYDTKNKITAMMRTTAYPISIIAQMIKNGIIDDNGVFGNEEIIPPQHFIDELNKRNIKLQKTIEIGKKP